MESTPLPETLRRLDALIQQEGLERSEFLDAGRLAVRTALPEDVVGALLRGGRPPAETVNERVRSRIRALADDRLARAGQRMSDLAGAISRQLGVSAFWARQVCAGDKVPSVELLHGLVDFFGVEGGEAFFTAPADEALDRELGSLLATLSTPERRTAVPSPSSGRDDVRGFALRQARDLPEERWNVLNATLKALLELDDQEGDR
ncbi:MULTISPECIES: hypothetical protein [unclassified Streptomyces]|uniref:hypothetical protein n=1 Tax=unclassified Streptomyces TaxID=2593676 RepID=UPI001F2D2BED|nr:MULTISPECIES: hypothetical protein [unclassified Streptomyces]WKE67802.1 hypothetical protein QHG49_01525 [Streptomyces sp. WP-1]